jgi:alpha-mannosidase
MLSGDFEYEFALYPFTGQWAGADLHRHAVEYNFPLVGTMAPAGNGTLEPTFQPVRVQSGDAMVSALFNRQGRTFVRVYDYRGTGGQVTLACAGPQPRVTEIDLAGHDRAAATSTFPIKPWEIKTVKVEHSIE